MTEEELMLIAVKKCRRVDLYVDQKPLNILQKRQLERIKRRRLSGEPLQYVIGDCEFMNVKLCVNKYVLIPRPETELLAQTVIHAVHSLEIKNPSILDLGSGSGNIALSLAKDIPDAVVTALDIFPKAIALSKQNARLNNLHGNLKFFQSDLFSYFENVAEKSVRFDIIVSNPPYIPTKQLSRLPQDVQKEPRIALDGGQDGLDFYRKIAKESPKFLKKSGIIFLEMGDGQAKDIKDIFLQTGQWNIKQILKDFNQKERVLEARLK